MLTLEEYEKLNTRCELVHDGITMQYYTPTTFTQWRVDTFFDKEPITVKVLSFLFYLPQDNALAHLGTSIYVPKDRRHVSDGTTHHKPEYFDRLVTMPFVPNSLFAFLKTPNAFHGVEPVVEPDVRRDLLLYDIKVRGEPSAVAPPPKQVATNTRFSF